VDIKWKDNKPAIVIIKSNIKNKCIVRSATALTLKGSTIKPNEHNGFYILEFDAEQGKVYELSPI